MSASLTVFICTHNRAELLRRTLHHLNQARRPAISVSILVIANACSDDTQRLLEAYQAEAAEQDWLALDWHAEPRPGKSHALNCGLALIESTLVAFVDDDHRVAEDFLVETVKAAAAFPETTLFCGRILPDWDGSEPAWVHDEGPYRIYPLPVPCFDCGDAGFEIDAQGRLPGGGNLFARTEALRRTGRFSIELGPKGHDLGGGEDTEFIARALNQGERLRYIPTVVQHHFVEHERLELRYLLRKSYQRSKAAMQIQAPSRQIPRYMVRKLVEHGGRALFSLNVSRSRFYLMRVAATLGEIAGTRAARQQRPSWCSFDRPLRWPLWLAAIGTGLTGMALTRPSLESEAVAALTSSAVMALLLTLALVTKSIIDFSQTGPQIRDEVTGAFRFYTLYAMGRLAFWCWLILTLTGSLGAAGWMAVSTLQQADVPGPMALGAAALLSSGMVVLGRFCHLLLHRPAALAASAHYRLSRLYPLWRRLSPARLRHAATLLLLIPTGLLTAAAIVALLRGEPALAALHGGLLLTLTGIAGWSFLPRALQSGPLRTGAPMNLLMIGVDTLRSDRIGRLRHGKPLSPTLDALAERGLFYPNCYTPCARTAPSLISLLTGTWPHRHGVRDNFVDDGQTQLPVTALPELLRAAGYHTAAISDWCGADLGKFSFGFEQVDLPEDQWNLKYLIRQGPKDLRLFLSLFTHSHFGRRFLPELYYLAGIPLTRHLSQRACHAIDQLAGQPKPFFLNLFLSTTHPPFGSEYPHYISQSDPAYQGESKFVMTRLTDPFEIIARQGEAREEFDLDQIIDLYDGCVANLDAELARILRHLQQRGLTQNTLLVLYSDHGMEFFEHDTWGQGNSAIGEASPRTPLILVDPRQPPRGKSAAVVRSIDLLPTLLELLGITAADEIDGVSLAAHLTEGRPPAMLDAFNETGIWLTPPPGMPADHLRYPDLLELIEVADKHSGTLGIKPDYRQQIVLAKDRMLRRGHWKLVHQPLQQGARQLLFDLERDPHCQHDLAAQHPEVVAQLWPRLDGWIMADPLMRTAPGPAGDGAVRSP